MSPSSKAMPLKTTRKKKAKKKKQKIYWHRVILFFVSAFVIACLLYLVVHAATPVVEDAVYPRTYQQYVEKAARKYDLDDNLVYAVIRQESRFDPDAVSSVNARGLMQVTEETFNWISYQMGNEGQYDFEDLAQPKVGIEYGCFMLHYLMEEFDGETEVVLAAYHAGMTITHTWLETPEYSSDGRTLNVIPYSDTEYYVTTVMDNYEHYQEIYDGKE